MSPSYSRNALSELSETQFDNWAKPESFEIVEEFAYRNGNILGSPDKDSAEVLPADYASSVKKVAERRAVLAGSRIADLLLKSDDLTRYHPPTTRAIPVHYSPVIPLILNTVQLRSTVETVLNKSRKTYGGIMFPVLQSSPSIAN